MSLGQIIRKKREQLNLTLDEVSSRIGFSKPYLSTIETGKVKNPPGDELLTKLEKTLEFEPGRLLHIAHMEGLPSDVRQEYESAEAENEKFRQFIKNLVHKKNDIVGLDAVLAESKLNFDELSRVDIEQAGPVLSAGRLVPVINKVSAGYPSDFNDLDYPVGVADDYVRCPDLHDPNAFAVRVVGDSMEPKFREGDIVIFSPAAEVHNGDDCFVRFAMPHETAFKRVFFDPDNKVRLQPRNEKYSPQIVDGKRINGLYRAIIKYEKL
jgi:phage repressor protein C with HTH and peptisase S24 domain/DNA-binding Xre family transcriptional regulator